MMDEVEGEKICIAHSLGTTNWLIGALNDIYQKPFDRVLLVAPPDPEMTSQAEGIKGEPLDLSNPSLEAQAKKWAGELLVIASENDKWLPRGIEIYRDALQLQPLILSGAGHFSLDDGWGEWCGLQEWIDSGNPDLILAR